MVKRKYSTSPEGKQKPVTFSERYERVTFLIGSNTIRKTDSTAL